LSAKLDVRPDPAAAVADMLIEVASSGGQLALSGGSTPRPAYERAAVTDWDRATIWFADERCVPPDDERSNYRMVHEALLSKTNPTVHRIQGELGPTEAADAYERELRDAGPPTFDLVLLGLGPDGHTASLFPDQPSLSERERLAIGVEQAGLEPFVPRVTLTLRALSAGRRIVFLATGPEKADAVAAAFGPDAKPDPHWPASLLPPLAGEVTVVLDEAAAGKIAR
jgi:6-phosphogluconolactonase